MYCNIYLMKVRNALSGAFILKWNKYALYYLKWTTAMSKIQIYFLDLIRYEFGTPDLHTESIVKWIIKKESVAWEVYIKDTKVLWQICLQRVKRELYSFYTYSSFPTECPPAGQEIYLPLTKSPSTPSPPPPRLLTGNPVTTMFRQQTTSGLQRKRSPSS